MAYHEVGYVLDDESYYVIVLTQLNQLDYKEKFINDVFVKIKELHCLIKKSKDIN